MEASPPEKRGEKRTTGRLVFFGEGGREISFFLRYIIRGLAYVFLCDFRRAWQICFVPFGTIFPVILRVIDDLETFSHLYMIYKS